MYCSNCGAQLANGASFCSSCGEKNSQQAPMQQAPMQQAPMQQAPMQHAPMQQAPMWQAPPKKKRKGLGCLIAVLVAFSIMGLIIAIAVTSDTPTQGKLENSAEQPKTAEEIKAEGLEFDEKSWSDFITLYEAHNHFMNAVDVYSQGNASELDFYDYCKKAEEWFRNASLSYNYAETEDEKKYLSTFSDFALADQIAVKNLIKYLDSNSTKDLSKAREEIERAKQAASIIASNRVVFLNSIGLSKEEVDEIVNKAIADIEKSESK